MIKNIDSFLRHTGLKGMIAIIVAALLFLAVVFVFGCAIKYVCTNHEITKDYSEMYEKTALNTSCVKIIDDCPNVRAEPIDASVETNSFGTTKECNFTLEVSKVYTMDKSLDTNGKYIGLKVSDILDTTEGKSWFPEKIKNDPDGIVWINENYIKLL